MRFGKMVQQATSELLETERNRQAAMIRDAYPWLEENKIMYYADLAAKKKYENK